MSNNMKLHNQSFDIIGDIHGQAGALIRLLNKLDYIKGSDGIYSHPERKVIFLGDFIDRGNEQALVIDIVMKMVESSNALAVMGNHEYNAICYHTSDEQGNPLREHSEKNYKQHQAFLTEFPVDDDRTFKVINWFKTLPLFLELEDFRVIHACWDKNSINFIKSRLSSNHIITDDFLFKSSDSSSEEFNAIETILKGTELDLPDGNSFLDKDGNLRTRISATLLQIIHLKSILTKNWPNLLLFLELSTNGLKVKPVFQPFQTLVFHTIS